MVDGIVRSIGYYEKEELAAADYARAAFKYKAKKVSNDGNTLYGGLDLSSVQEQPLIRSDTSASGYLGVKKMKGRWQARIGKKGQGAHDIGDIRYCRGGGTYRLPGGLLSRSAKWEEGD